MTDLDTLIRRADPVGPAVSADDEAARYLLAAVLAGTATRASSLAAPAPRRRHRALVAAGAAGAAAALIAGVLAVVRTERPITVVRPGGDISFVQVTPWSEVHSAGPVQTPAPLSSAERASLESGHPLDPTSIDCYFGPGDEMRVDGIVATGGDPVEGCRSLMTRDAAMGVASVPTYPVDSSVCVRAATGGLVVLPGHLSCVAVGPTWVGSYTDEEQAVIAAWVRSSADSGNATSCASAADVTARTQKILADVGLRDWTVAVGQMNGATGNGCYAIVRINPQHKTLEMWPTGMTVGASGGPSLR